MSITDKIGDQLGKKLGPLPVWGWGVIGAAGVWIFRSMGIGKPSPARTSSGIGRVSLGSGSGGAMAGSYPPPVSPAFGPPTTPRNAQTPGYSISGAGSEVLQLLKDFTYVGTSEQPTEVQQPTINPPPKVTIIPPAVHVPEALIPPEPVMYTIRRGDTLSKIARRYGTSWRTLWANNRTRLRSSNPDLIFPGERIQVN